MRNLLLGVNVNSSLIHSYTVIFINNICDLSKTNLANCRSLSVAVLHQGEHIVDARLNMIPAVCLAARIVQPDPAVLVSRHLSLVRRIAVQVQSRVSHAIELDDLIQIGRVALIEASRQFVDRGEAVFATYATLRIRGAMIDQLRKSAHVVRSAMRHRREFRAVHTRLQCELRRPPTETEMAARVDMSIEAYRAAVRAGAAVIHESIDDAYSDKNAAFVDEAPSAFDDLESKVRRDALAAAIAKLPERQAMVLQLYFIDELSLEDIGQTLGVGGSRVCQIKSAALNGLRASLEDWTTGATCRPISLRSA